MYPDCRGVPFERTFRVHAGGHPLCLGRRARPGRGRRRARRRACKPSDDGPRVSVDRGELPPEGAGPIRGALLEVAGRTREDILSAAVNLKNLGYTAAVVPVKPSGRERAGADELAWAADACETAKLRFVAYISLLP